MNKILFLLCTVSICRAKVYDSKRYDNHTQAVTAIAFDKEGRSIITGSLDGVICKRGLGQAYEGKTVEGLGPITHLARIEKYIAAVHEKCDCGDDKVKHPHPEFYNIANLSYKSSGALQRGGHDRSIAAMNVINGKSMVTVDTMGKLVFLYNCMRVVVIDFPIVNSLVNDRLHVAGVDRLTKASPSRIIGASHLSDSLYYFDPEIGTLVKKKVIEKDTKITALAALKSYLLSLVTHDNRVILLNEKTGVDVVNWLGKHSADIIDIKKINRRLFATADKDGVVKVWNAKTGAIQLELKHDEKNVKTNEKSVVTSLAVHWNKQRKEGKIAIGHQNGVTIVWKYNLEDNKEIS